MIGAELLYYIIRIIYVGIGLMFLFSYVATATPIHSQEYLTISHVYSLVAQDVLSRDVFQEDYSFDGRRYGIKIELLSTDYQVEKVTYYNKEYYYRFADIAGHRYHLMRGNLYYNQSHMIELSIVVPRYG
ncbi:MAG: hypothetical protein ACMXYC_04595 [Candidatus Woesearchaeota archaeon]